MKLASKLRRFYHRVQFGREHSGLRGLRSASDNGLYPAFCRKAAIDSRLFSTFRRHPIYNQILEHVPQARGQKYLDHISLHDPDLLERFDDFKINDTIGHPRVFEFDRIGTTSPTTLRYVKVAGQIRSLFGESLDGDIAEIGGGYGGQLLVLDQLIRYRRYTIFDMAPVNLLVERYLDCFVLNGGYATHTLNQSAGDHPFDLVISNYAFSELPQAIQQTYIDKVLSRSKRGYITMNSGKPETAFFDGRMTIEQLEASLPAFEIVEENKFGRGEYIIAWGHQSARKLGSKTRAKAKAEAAVKA